MDEYGVSQPSVRDERAEGQVFYGQPVVDAGILQIRLNTQSLIDDVELFLRGYRPVATGDPDNPIGSVKIGDPLANSLGVQGILSFMIMAVNPHTVQGNYTEERYVEVVVWMRKELAYLLTLNTQKWGISSYNRVLICDSIMNLTKPFLSRLIANKERESYAQTMVRTETSTVGRRGGVSDFFNMFKKK